MRLITRCIAAGSELWFEKPGFPPVPLHPKLPRPWQNAVWCWAKPFIQPMAGRQKGAQKGALSEAVFLVEERIRNAGAQAVDRFRGHEFGRFRQRRVRARSDRSAASLAARAAGGGDPGDG